MDNKIKTPPQPAVDPKSKQLIHVTVRDKNGILVNDDVRAVTSYNDVGLFDVLPWHTNFISLIRQKLVLHKKDATNKEMKVGLGLLMVTDNEIHVYLGLPDAAAAAALSQNK
ncbi:MAG TPA: hypothetical protein VG965_03015 [Patescibacteria group bacterium]|nr:hypothetical protein [Patescibacteria group bacterium]